MPLQISSEQHESNALQSPIAGAKLEIAQHLGAAHEVKRIEHVDAAVFGNNERVLHEGREGN